MSALPASVIVLPSVCAAGFLLGWTCDHVVPRLLPTVGFRRGAGIRSVTAAALAALFLAMVLRFGLDSKLAAYLLFAVSAVVLSRIDLQSKLLPNAVVFPTFWLGAILLAFDAILHQTWSSLLRAGIGAALLFLIYLVLAVISPAGLGMGDVKLAGIIGMFSAYLGWPVLFIAGTLGFLLGGVVGVFLLLVRRAKWSTEFPFGPSMLAATIVAIAGSEVFAPLFFAA